MKPFGNVLIVLSIVAAVLALIGAAGTDLWLASTQWLIVAVILGVYAIYAKTK